jgi:hypothetical protein
MADDIRGERSRASAHGPIRVTLPAAIAYDPDALKKSLGDILGQIGCKACCSGADILLQMEREFVADRDLRFRARGPLEGPQPDPWRGAKHQYTVALSPKVSYDIDKVFGAIDRVIDILGPCACCSGFDVLLKDELQTIVVNEQLEAVKLDAAF